MPEEGTLGIREEDWPSTPEEIARHLALMDQLVPLEMSPEEEAVWRTTQNTQKEYELGRFEEWSKGIEDLFR